jgi:predicted nuclease of predicted toxin-antitoxin system
MLRFLVDTQLPPALAKFLENKGHQAAHTIGYPNGHLPSDREIVGLATQNRQIIVTKDSDFLDNYLLKGAPPDVLLLELGNIKNTDLLQVFERNMPAIQGAFEQGTHFAILDKRSLIQF